MNAYMEKRLREAKKYTGNRKGFGIFAILAVIAVAGILGMSREGRQGLFVALPDLPDLLKRQLPWVISEAQPQVPFIDDEVGRQGEAGSAKRLQTKQR